jgi:hypothetical protein
MAPLERVLFEAMPGMQYRLTYGSPLLAAPSYDLARTIGDLETWAASAGEARLGEAVRRSEKGPRPWTERNPALLWAGLLAAVVVLGAITWWALQKG